MSRPLNIVASPVIYKDKFLLIKRNKEPYTGFWSLIGGKIEFGEDIRRAIVREIQEETSLKTKFVAVRGVVYETLKDGKKESTTLLFGFAKRTQPIIGQKSKTKGKSDGLQKPTLLNTRN